MRSVFVKVLRKLQLRAKLPMTFWMWSLCCVNLWARDLGYSRSPAGLPSCCCTCTSLLRTQLPPWGRSPCFYTKQECPQWCRCPRVQTWDSRRREGDLASSKSTSRASVPGQDILTPKMAHSRNFISLQWTPRMTTGWDLSLWIRKDNFLIIIRASSYLGVLRLYRQ